MVSKIVRFVITALVVFLNFHDPDELCSVIAYDRVFTVELYIHLEIKN